MSTLFDQTMLGRLPMKNRLVRSATGENLATAEGHIPQDLTDTYVQLAKGGVGMIILGFTSVAPVDHFREGLMRLHDDALIPEYHKLAEILHEYCCIVVHSLLLVFILKK